MMILGLMNRFLNHGSFFQTFNIKGIYTIFKNIRIVIPQLLDLHYADTSAQVKGDFFVSGAINKPELVGQLNIQNLYFFYF